MAAVDRLAHRFAGEQLVEGLFQIVVLDLLILLEPRGIAVVDAAAVAKHEVVIEREDLGRLFGLEGGDRHPLAVLQNGETELEVARLLGDRRGRLSLARANADKVDPLGGIPLGHLGQHRRVRRGDGALKPQEDDDGRLRAGQVVQRNLLARCRQPA